LYIPISGLPPAPAIDGTEQIPVVQAGVTKRISAALLVGPILPPNGHLQTAGGTPAAVYSAGDGGAITSVVGTDSAGEVIFQTGTGWGALLIAVEVNFVAAWALAPIVLAQLVDPAGAPQGVVAQGGTLHIKFSVVSAVASGAYRLSWIAVGRPN